MMEEKQLDFNQPLLSVRRFSPTAPSSKHDNKRKSENHHHSIPPLPLYKSELKSGPVRHPGTVPFTWEQTPGRPKDKGIFQAPEASAIAPKPPPGRILNAKQQNSEDPVSARPQSSWDESLAKVESPTEESDEDKKSSGTGDEAYVDALDILSRTDSFFLNCSASGLSGVDGSATKPSGVFSTDFMMGRFLPAAKAIASETPQYVSKKQREPQKEAKKVVDGNKELPIYRGSKESPLRHFKPDGLLHHTQYHEPDESEDRDSDYYESEYFPGKGCGMFPRFCLKNSLPVPGMRIGAKAPASSVGKVRAKSSYVGFHVKSEIEQCRGVGFEKEIMGKHQAAERSGNRSKFESKSSPIINQTKSRKPDGSYLYERLQGVGFSPHRNGRSRFSCHKEEGLCGNLEEAICLRNIDSDSHEKGPKNFQELLSADDLESDLASPVVEKTLYIDSVYVVRSRNSNSSSSSSNYLMDPKEDPGNFRTGYRAEDSSFLDSTLHDVKNLSVSNEKSPVQPGWPDEKMRADGMKSLRLEENFIGDSVTLAGLEDPHKVGHEQNSDNNCLHFLLPPPLPKSPSESWLGRTLPSLLSKNPSSRPCLGVQMHHRPQPPKATPKSYISHNGHIPPLKEPLAPVQEN